MSRSTLAVVAAATLVLVGCQAQPLDTTQASDPDPSQAQPQAAPAPPPAPSPASPAPMRSAPAVAQAPAPAPAPVPKPSRTTLAAGTVLDVQLAQDLSSADNQNGDPFSMTVTTPIQKDGRTVVAAGSIVRGTLQEVKAAKRGGGHATMTLQFEEIELPSGYSAPIVAKLSEETGGTKKRNAAIIGGSAAGGAILGKVLGDDSKDAAIGALVAGAIATGVVFSQEGKQVEIPAGSAFSIQLEQELAVPLAPPAS